MSVMNQSSIGSILMNDVSTLNLILLLIILTLVVKKK